MRRTWLLLVPVLLASCGGDDNKAIRASEDVFRYDGWHRDDRENDEDWVVLEFTNIRTGDDMEWRGSVGDALRHLAYLNERLCYRHPLSREGSEEASCQR